MTYNVFGGTLDLAQSVNKSEVSYYVSVGHRTAHSPTTADCCNFNVYCTCTSTDGGKCVSG